MQQQSPILVVLGSGPGIGITTAKLFASKNHFSKIALVSRDGDRLLKEKAELADVEVEVFPTDISDPVQLHQTLSKIEKLGPLGCVFFNAARIKPSEILTTGIEEIEEDFKLTNIGLYIVAQWAIPLLKQSKVPAPTLVVTSSHLPEQPYPILLSLSATKASQQNIVHSLRAAFGEEIHIGVVKVAGQVSPDAKNLNPPNIAKEMVAFYEQPREQWGSDVVIHE